MRSRQPRTAGCWSSGAAAASTRWRWRCPATPASPRCTPPRATRAWPPSPPCTPSTRWTARRSPTSPSGLGADLVVIGPEAPLVAGVADAVRDRGIACFGPSRRGRAARGLQGLRQGGDGRRRRPHRRGAGVHHPRGGRRRARRVRGAVRRQGRRARRRQGGRGHRRPGGGAGARRGLRPGGHRGVPRRSGGVAVRDHRRDDGRAAAAGPGLQARPGRGRRPEHRRDGRLHAAAVGAGRPRRGGHRAGPPADRRRDAAPRHPVRRAAVRRARAHPPRHPGGGVQRPLRRPRDPAADGAARLPAGDPAARRRRRHPGRPGTAHLAGRRRRGGGRRGRELPRDAADR